MGTSVFPEIKFWLLVIFSFVLPTGAYIALFTTHTISKRLIFLFGLSLLAIAGVDVYLLQILARSARLSPSLLDDQVFNSELTIALYVLPALFAGTGINLVSHALIRHLEKAERRFEREHPEDRGTG